MFGRDEKTSNPSLEDKSPEFGNLNPGSALQGPSLDSAVPSSGFSEVDFSFLARNENFRYAQNSRQVGHAVFTKHPQGGMIAAQFALPVGSGTDTPNVVLLSNIEPIMRYGRTKYCAKGPDGKRMYARRFHHAKTGKAGFKGETELEIAYFSEEESPGKEPHWGGNGKPVPLISNRLNPEQKNELNDEIAEIKPVTKGGPELIIDHPSVKKRDENKTRTPDQNTVMGQSAKDAYEAFMDSMMEELSDPMKKILRRAIDAPLKNIFYSNHRPEWLHLYGFSLTPINMNPQTQANLGSAPKWANTAMMVLERIAKWFVLNRPESFVTIKPVFEMLWDTELVKHISFRVSISEKERWVRFIQELDIFIEHPLFSKASDLAQATGITHSLLHGEPPILQQKVAWNDFVLPSGGGPIPMSSSNITPPPMTTSSKSRSKPDTEAAVPLQHDNPPYGDKERLMHDRPKNSLQSRVKSLVQIFVTSQIPNYVEPWGAVSKENSTGTGFIFAQNGKNYILTNAHVVADSLLIRVRVANKRDKQYKASPVCISYQCDLAVLEVKDPEFLAYIEPVNFGEMVKPQDKVQTMGFPMGGEELCITKGIVSRIEVSDYSMSGQNMLQVQVDAGINPGNSGGPVFSNGKVVGIAFQGISYAQNIGYMIPMPIVQHFITEVFSKKSYRGFPIIPFKTQNLVNPYLRRYYGMSTHHTGVRIIAVDNLCDAYSKLRVNDIVFEIDGLPVSNEGTIDVPGVGACLHMVHAMHVHFVGESIQLKVLRKDPETGISAIHDINITLDTVPEETEMVGAMNHDVMPTYYINSGVVFCPVTQNYLEESGEEILETFVLDHGCSLPQMPKKQPGQEYVIIHDVLDCEENEGYQDYVGKLVKEVNGKHINNMHDIIHAMGSNASDKHTIFTFGNKVIVVKNMSPDEHTKLLEHYKIPNDCSLSLRNVSATRAAMEEVVTKARSAVLKASSDALAAIAKVEGTAISSMKRVGSSTAGMASVFATSGASTGRPQTTSSSPSGGTLKEISEILPPTEHRKRSVAERTTVSTRQQDSRPKKRQKTIESSSDSEPLREEILPSFLGKRKKQQSRHGVTPGQARFSSFVGDLMQRVVRGELEDENEDDLIVSARRLSQSDSERKGGIEESSSQSDDQEKVAPPLKRDRRNFFKQPNARIRGDDSAKKPEMIPFPQRNFR